MPRYSARVSNGTMESTVEEEAASEAALRQALAARGWTNVLAVREFEPPDPEIREDGPWTYVPVHIAEQHPLYGVGGWMALLMVLLAIGAAFGVFTFFRLAGHFGQGGLIAFLVVLLGVTTAAQIACLVLGAMKSPAFPPVFIVLAVLSIVFAVIGMAQDRASLADIAAVVINAIWIGYVSVSRRVNVTYRRRVANTDAQFADVLDRARGR
jgi:hypothetical protein